MTLMHATNLIRSFNLGRSRMNGLIERRLCARARRASRAGQTAVEYILAAGVLVACVGVMAVLLYALRQHAGRVLLLIGSDYP